VNVSANTTADSVVRASTFSAGPFFDGAIAA
jgi:hypothetical protein